MTEASKTADLFYRIRTLRVDGQYWASGLVIATLFGIAAVSFHGWMTGDVSKLVAALLLCGSSLLVGTLLGFLFGIPRSLQSESPPPPTVDRDQSPEMKQEAQRLRIQYRANTNLEQISDWLTKILVGVGLTQLGSLPDFASRMGDYFGSAIGLSADASRIAICIIVLFSVSGFLIGYLWTRLFLGGELARADLSAVTEQVREVVEAQEQQGQIDAKAIGLTYQYLSMSDPGKISIQALKQAIEYASPPVKVQIFYQAREARSRSWQHNEDKWILDRTIPIFEALIASDKENRFHKNHGQLGFALKDKRKPDYARAEVELGTAIENRGPVSEGGWELYEFNRAICRVKLDDDFAAERPSSPDVRAKILSDIKIATAAYPDLYGEPDLIKWLQINGIRDVITPPGASD